MAEVFIVIGLGYGDEGKGSVVDYLTREHNAHTIVRFNGGAQAAHNVVTPDGKHHTFAQFGSGTLAGARTHLSRFMLVNPFDFWLEERHLQQLSVWNARRLITFSPDALVTTPLHVVANQMREERRNDKHGTCGKGIGETQEAADVLGEPAIRIGDLRKQGIVERKLTQLSDYYHDTISRRFPQEHGSIAEIARAYRDFSDKVAIQDDSLIYDLQHKGHTLIFEGAQGILLDQDVGFHPHTTWSDTTSSIAQKMLIGTARPTTIGVTRPYMTRHGHGPFPGGGGGYMSMLDEPHNDDDGHQGIFRYGRWDEVCMAYAVKCNPIDAVAVTCLDHLGEEWSTVNSYDYLGSMPDLKPYFQTDGKKRILEIMPPRTRAESEAITNRLQQCSWNVIEHEDTSTEYVTEHISSILGAPVAIESYGPTYEDKKTQHVRQMVTRSRR